MPIERYNPAIGKGAIPTEAAPAIKNARRYTKTQAQIIASCDFRPLDFGELDYPLGILGGEGVEGGFSTNGFLLSLREMLNALAQESIATNIANYDLVGAEAGRIAGEAVGEINVYQQQLTELKRFFGVNVGTSDDMTGVLADDIANLNTVLQALEEAIDLMDFAHTGVDMSALLDTLYDLENDTILGSEPAEFGYYYDLKFPASAKPFPNMWEGVMNTSLGFNIGVSEGFSSTKIFLQLLQGVGFAASRYLPNLGPDSLSADREDDEGSPYCIRPVPDFSFDILSKLSYKTAAGGFATPMPGTFLTTKTTAWRVIDRMLDEIGEVDGIEAAFEDEPFFANVNQLDRLIMLLSRELSNSAALGYYESSADEQDLRDRLENSGGLNITSHPDGASTYARNVTNLVNNTSNHSPFNASKWKPVKITTTERGSYVVESGKPPAPANFAQLKVAEAGFPGGVTGIQACSLFEKNALAIDDDDPIMGTRDFLVGAVFDRDELYTARTEGVTFGNRPELSRLTTAQKEFSITMKIYRDYIIEMTALRDVDTVQLPRTTTPHAVFHELLANDEMRDLMYEMTRWIPPPDEDDPPPPPPEEDDDDDDDGARDAGHGDGGDDADVLDEEDDDVLGAAEIADDDEIADIAE